MLAVLIIGNGCGIFGGVRLYEGASGKKEEGDTTKKKVKKSNSPMGVGVPKSKKHVKWEQETNLLEAKRTRRKLLEKRVRDKKAAKKREKERKKKQAEMEKEKKKQQAKMDKHKAEMESRQDKREAVGMDF